MKNTLKLVAGLALSGLFLAAHAQAPMQDAKVKDDKVKTKDGKMKDDKMKMKDEKVKAKDGKPTKIKADGEKAKM